METTERQPWDQLPGEPEAAFARFLLYRNMGVGRSLNAAYRKYLALSGEVVKGTEKHPGNWQQHSLQFDWVNRALKWDIANLQTVGRRTAAAVAAYLEWASLKAIEGLADFKPTITTWQDALRVAEALMQIVSPETIQALVKSGQNGKGSKP